MFPPLLSSIIHVYFTFCRNCIRNFAVMPTIAEVSEEDLQRMLGDGGLKPETLTRRRRSYDEVYILSLLSVNNGRALNF